VSGTLYDLALRGARPLLRAFAPFSPKLAHGMRARAGAAARLEAWAARGRDARRPLIWLHAPSVGETLMAQAISAELRVQRPDAQIAFTWFSPSAERVAGRVAADVADYLPWDVRADARRTVAALRPDAVAFVRTEIWPMMMEAAISVGARTLLVNAALAPGSSRLRRPARALLARWYARLDAVGAVDEDAAARFGRLGVTAARVRITGDARVDQVAAHVARVQHASPAVARFARMRVLVAGSTWPADEALLAAAFARLAAHGGETRLIIAPHEPTPRHLARLERTLARARVSTTRLAAVEAGEPVPAAVIVDRVGVLAELYATAAVAFVGGGFGRNGLHSVIEPAAFGVPVLFGPRVGNAREALALARAGGGRIVADENALCAALARLLGDEAARAAASAAARRFVADRRGGAAANAALIAALLD
jgi:3-deoxy-D-manno-octulosonic-acid transferase